MRGDMTDLYNLQELLETFGVDYCIEDTGQGITTLLISKEEGHSGVVGLIGYKTIFDFNEEGDFLQMGVWT